MALYKNKFVELDPDTCSIEELKEAIEKLDELGGYYETKQLAIKTFLNSVYGATASVYFVAHNVDVAESITLQGQDLNHYSENRVNDYFSGIFQSREEYDKIIQVPVLDYVEKYPITANLSIITKTENGWVPVTLPDDFMKEYSSGADEYSETAKKSVKNIYVQLTFGAYLGVPYEKIQKIDMNAGRITKQKLLTDAVFKYLEHPEHISLTIAGDTDSCINSTKIYVDDNKLTIEEAFNKFKYENFDIILKLPNGQEIIPVKKHITKTYLEETNDVVDRPIKYIMRHKVTKAKFKITSETGKELIITGDHSIMVIRDNKLIAVKAKDINIKTDKIIFNKINKAQIVGIKSVEQLDDFQDEYVYDIEVDDTHTFFANDILAHNSIYVEFGRLVNQVGLEMAPDKATRFVVDLWQYGCGPYMKRMYEQYAEDYNCDKNLEELELEKIADTALMTSKKHYAMSKCWAEPNIFYDIGTHISYTGLEIIQGSTAKYPKECMTDFVNFCVTWFGTHREKPSFDILYDKICGYKKGITMQNPEDLCKLLKISDYNNWVIDDKNTLNMCKGIPFHINGAATGNYLLNQPQNKKYKQKYGLLRAGDKIRVYPTTDPKYPWFAYTPGKFPIEYAPGIDYDAIFEKNILSLINTILEILEYKPLNASLCYTSALF